ncbi:hypothetical protein J6590_013290 [Homalodisca vitripennis]|nr:hypothetical protein J6590_013290 [Homalodisca vitripennis]
MRTIKEARSGDKTVSEWDYHHPHWFPRSCGTPAEKPRGTFQLTDDRMVEIPTADGNDLAAPRFSPGRRGAPLADVLSVTPEDDRQVPGKVAATRCADALDHFAVIAYLKSTPNDNVPFTERLVCTECGVKTRENPGYRACVWSTYREFPQMNQNFDEPFMDKASQVSGMPPKDDNNSVNQSQVRRLAVVVWCGSRDQCIDSGTSSKWLNGGRNVPVSCQLTTATRRQIPRRRTTPVDASPGIIGDINAGDTIFRHVTPPPYLNINLLLTVLFLPSLIRQESICSWESTRLLMASRSFDHLASQEQTAMISQAGRQNLANIRCHMNGGDKSCRKWKGGSENDFSVCVRNDANVDRDITILQVTEIASTTIRETRQPRDSVYNVEQRGCD